MSSLENGHPFHIFPIFLACSYLYAQIDKTEFMNANAISSFQSGRLIII